MHDIVFASRIVRLIKERIDTPQSGRHIIINILLSPFTHVTPESLTNTFKTLIEKEGFKNTVLNIERREIIIICRRCKFLTRIKEPILACPICSSSEFDIDEGEEFLIKSIEIEEV